MIGNIRWNFIISSIGMLLTMLFSLKSNVFFTSLIRGLYCFIVLFIASFIVRWFLYYILKMKYNSIASQPKQSDELSKGNHVDISTPEELEEHETLNTQHIHQFSPLSPPRFQSSEQVDAEEVVKVIRHMSED